MEKDTYHKGYRLKLYPTEEQKELIQHFVNVYRSVYNWGIARQKEHYEEKQNGNSKFGFYSFFELCKLFAEYRKNIEWLSDVPNSTVRLALKDVINSYNRFFNSGFGYPKFKNKKRSPKYFRTRNDRFYIDGDQIRFEGLKMYSRGPNALVDTVNLHFDTGFKRRDKIKYLKPCIHIDHLGNYWVSFQIEVDKKELNIPKTEPIGIDVGIRHTITLSTGEQFDRPNKKLKRLEKRKRKLQSRYSLDIKRRVKEANRTKTKYENVPVSNRSQKRLNRLRKIYTKITNIKRNFYHETIKQIVTRNPEAIVIETIRTKSMRKSKDISKLLKHELHGSDFYTMHRIIEQKCNTYNIPLIRADECYPSSQICSNCGYKYDIGNKHTYHCPNCGMRMDRDINAALNLRSLAYLS